MNRVSQSSADDSATGRREFPFELFIRRLDAKGLLDIRPGPRGAVPEEGTLRSGEAALETVLCGAHLRVIAGNREVFDAEWNGKKVIVKLFLRWLGAKYRLKREWNGLVLLGSRGVNAPKPLFCGQTAEGKWAVVTEKIADSRELLDVFREERAEEKRAQLLTKVCKELAAQHEKGILQKDLHLGNFLLNGSKLVALDPAQMRFMPDSVGKKKSISQLALLTSNLTGTEARYARDIWREYFNRRDWQFGACDERLLREQTTLHKKKWLNRTLKKCIRTSSKFLRIRTWSDVAVFDRRFIEGTEPADFVRKIDELAEKGDVLKRGNTSCVRRLLWNGKDIVIKRYSHKGLFHSLRHTIKGSRAKQCWLDGHRLIMSGIPTPRPLAFIERRKWGLVWKSYLVTEYVDGQNLYHFLRDEKVNAESRQAIVRRVLEMLEKLQENRITHRDLKLSNILVTAEGPVLTDLDAMKVHKLRFISRWKGRKYIERLKRDVTEKGV